MTSLQTSDPPATDDDDEDRVSRLSLNRLPTIRGIIERGESLSPGAATWLLAQFDLQCHEAHTVWLDNLRLQHEVGVARDAAADALQWVRDVAEFLGNRVGARADRLQAVAEGRAA